MKEGYKFDDKGEMVPIDVYIVWGSPGSGKTTHVRNNMVNGDLVVDLDLIKQSLSLKGKTEAHDNLINIALSVREHIYKIIEHRKLNCNNVWVVAGLPDADERMKLQKRLNAKSIFIDASKEKCIYQAMNDEEREDKEIQIKIINKWFNIFYGDNNAE